MICSMTGFGRSELVNETLKLTVELKSVNHKYLELNVKMPRKFNAFEAKIRNSLKKYATRGKVDLFINYDNQSESQKSLKYNSTLAKEYYDYYKAIQQELGLDEDIKVSTIAKCPEVIVLEEQQIDEEELWAVIEPVLNQAFAAFRDARSIEGESLKNNILEKLEDMIRIVDFIESHLPEIITEYRTKLEDRVKEFLENSLIDESRIAAEVTMYSDKVAVDEELVRLRTHIKNMRDILIKGGEVGRNLDFLAQEMNRESNTILSKSNNIDITNCGIELKTCIEKIREQVQNIE